MKGETLKAGGRIMINMYHALSGNHKILNTSAFSNQ